ncbi:sulfotransferase 2B1-like [Chiloscyllium plagiosum]|uniref:sulfotransferase 2B1-like n=1 Tax=Chiloscyllium plagiosum TaxID=36176 RepID=UPI001CB7F8EC|nr:sulfotransferase 2B1-like [Chiloscyllium plagiosum]
MSEAQLNIVFEGLLWPSHVHSEESLRYAREEFQVRDDDVFIVTYPKSGTTWLQEILPLIYSNGDLTPVHTIPNWQRVPWLEHKTGKSLLENRPSPRLITTHLTYHMMPKSFYTSKAKVVYVSRNPKDALVSSFHYHDMASFLENPGTFEEFIDKFLEGKVMFGSWFDHIKSWWPRKDQDNILFLTYEELLQDMRSALLKLKEFLGKQLSDDAIERIVTQTKFNNMKQNKMSNYSFVPEELMDQKKSNFLRKGISGDWKTHFTTAQTEHFNSVYTQEMKGINFPFYKD